LLFDRFCQQAAQGSWIDDVEAEQGGANEFHGVTLSLYHQIGDALERGMAKQDRAGVCIDRLRFRNSHRPPARRASTVRWSVGYTVITLASSGVSTVLSTS
jgi:hypothetical protein